ncbi:MAG: hypothetical protein FGF47_01870 [Candidatus Brockarchaeota archaeon]|nr:hypothetical protein [Candidatus Brockarchaeota archaeon]
MEGGLRRSCPQQASLSACPMPTRSASQADNDRYNEKNISFSVSAFISLRKLGGFPPSKLKVKVNIKKPLY